VRRLGMTWGRIIRPLRHGRAQVVVSARNIAHAMDQTRIKLPLEA